MAKRRGTRLTGVDRQRDQRKQLRHERIVGQREEERLNEQLSESEAQKREAAVQHERYLKRKEREDALKRAKRLKLAKKEREIAKAKEDRRHPLKARKNKKKAKRGKRLLARKQAGKLGNSKVFKGIVLFKRVLLYVYLPLIFITVFFMVMIVSAGFVAVISNSSDDAGALTSISQTSNGSSSNNSASLKGDTTGSDMKKNVKVAWDVLHALGYNDKASAAIIGNWCVESGVNPKSVQPNGAGRGIEQWDVSNRWKSMNSWAKKNNLDPYSVEAQVRYADVELKGAEGASLPSGLSGFKSTNDVNKATSDFMTKVERAGNKQSLVSRQQYANRILAGKGNLN